MSYKRTLIKALSFAFSKGGEYIVRRKKEREGSREKTIFLRNNTGFLWGGGAPLNQETLSISLPKVWVFQGAI